MAHSRLRAVARHLDCCGDKLRPGKFIEYIIGDADVKLPEDRFCAFSLWEAWRRYEARQYQQAFRDAFEPFEYFAPRRNA